VPERILLSVPHMEGHERSFVEQAFESNWLSTVGPHLEAFEQEFARLAGAPAVALSSGTAAIHLGLRLLGVGPGDEIFAPTLTFVASVNPVVYLGARPVFIDSDPATWNMDPQLLRETLAERAARNRLPRAVVVVHLYGQPADLGPILDACAPYDVPVLEDAAEALGTQYQGRQVGSFGHVGTFSFNGNKIITTTGGGMLVARDAGWVCRARFWATQARDPGIGYEHSDIGYNYRLSNVLAAIGRAQLQVLEKRVAQRRAIAFAYRDALADVDGLDFMPQAPYGRHTNWLSVFLVDEKRFGIDRDTLVRSLDEAGIESRPVWKPMHLQSLYASADRVGGGVAADLFRRGICLPSSSSLGADAQQRVIAAVRRARDR